MENAFCKFSTVMDKKEERFMFLGIEWYWWIVIVTVAGVSIPFKVKFMNWWSRRQREKKGEKHGKWGDEE